MKAFRYMKVFLSFIIISANVWAQDQNQENYIYQLSQSTGRYTFWTTLPSERVFKDDVVPSDTGSGILVYAARNEFEPFQLVVNPSVSGNITVNIGEFGSGIEVQLYQVKYVTIAQSTDNLGRTGDYPDPLWPLETSASVSVTAGENTAFWFDVHVPDTTPAGDYTTHVAIGGIDIPVTLHIFNFSIPERLHPKSQMNFSHQAFLTQYGVSCCGTEYWLYVDKIKQYFIDHRLTPKSVLWSGGLTSSGAGPYIDYDCAGTLTDTDGIWGFEAPAERYIDADGLMQGKFPQSFNNGTGFPSFMAATFRNNDASADQRPATFCGQTRSAADWYTADNPNTPYNENWFQYITAIQNYLASTGYLDKAYYYFANEPQDQADYAAVAWYSRYLKAAAPDFKLMVSEEPKPEIYEHSDYVQDGQVDIWLPVLNNYDPTISHDRKKNHGEETWIYFLYGTRPPFFNPVTLDHPGIESKLTGWFLWKYRIGGIAYYSLNNWSRNPWTDPMNSNHNGDLFMLYPPSPEGTPIAYGSNNHRFVPSIRFELMRDSLEDYEYFHVMNGNSAPQVYEVNAPDAQVEKIIKGVASYTRDSGFMYNLRRWIGLYNGGEIAEIPDITPPMEHPRAVGGRANYYINFQDPNGLPATTYTEDTYDNGYTYRYLTYANHGYLQVGTQEYDQIAGFGWLDDTEHFLTGRDPWGTEQDERKITCVYDDYAHHPSVFEFDLPNGTYSVEASVGTPRKVRPHNRLVIEGVTFIDDEASEYYIVRTRDVTVSDGKLTLDIGIWDYYTMINYLDIEPVYSLSDLDRSGQVDQADLELFAGVFGSACESGAYCMGDFDGDSDVDSTDLAAFVTDFSNPE
ncbi:glycoside hydrolase domain-containing protein [uncultured Desulfobacter sp.]|uniref:glycoside hydrolase domain-containing protein n=1 Tax=uncultured Desulfobacter sp. TaxID=240139 RepID=UPI002AA63C04|nr:glycoside hydrolase domain-containing protein [uncultured Desulfobacter sp.]